MRKWKVVTANVLIFQAAIEKEAAGFFASGRRLEFEECIANLNVGFSVCGIPRKPRAPSTPEHSRCILISTAPCTFGW